MKNDLYVIEENGVETDKVEIFFDQRVENVFAHLSRRIKEEADQSQMSGNEAGVLTRFIASQTVRTLCHKSTMSEQANGMPIDANTFVRVMVRKMKMLLDSWYREAWGVLGEAVGLAAAAGDEENGSGVERRRRGFDPRQPGRWRRR